MKKVTLKSIQGNLKNFNKEFIGAGCRTSVIGLYQKLIDLGAIPADRERDKYLISTRKNIVILCVNDGINSKFARVSIHTRNWWDFWHNKANRQTKPGYITYNVPKQISTVIDNLNITEIETLFPE